MAKIGSVVRVEVRGVMLYRVCFPGVEDFEYFSELKAKRKLGALRAKVTRSAKTH